MRARCHRLVDELPEDALQELVEAIESLADFYRHQVPEPAALTTSTRRVRSKGRIRYTVRPPIVFREAEWLNS